MRNVLFMLFAVGSFVGFQGVESAYSQLRVPPTHVAALASQPDDATLPQESWAEAWSAQPSAQVVPIQMTTTQQGQAPSPAPQPVTPQMVVPQAEMIPQVQPQPQVHLPQVMPQPGMMGGPIVIPVVVPQYVTYTPPPVTMMVQHPAQLVIPQYPPQMMVPMQQPMMPMYHPMAMPMMPPQAPTPQPIPVKMILPDGSKVSIKHYMPGQHFKNALRAVTP